MFFVVIVLDPCSTLFFFKSHDLSSHHVVANTEKEEQFLIVYLYSTLVSYIVFSSC